MMNVQEAQNPQEWDAFIGQQQFRPFLQSWTMGEVYRDTGQEPIRIEVRDNGEIVGICQAIVVPAKRGRHLSISYGPVLSYQLPATSYQLILDSLIQELKNVAREHRCVFIRMSPFWPTHLPYLSALSYLPHLPSPLHLLAEHLWYLPLRTNDPWQQNTQETDQPRTEEELLMAMRKTTRNLVRRAERDGVTVEASTNPLQDMEAFITLHEETRRRHGFTPYTDAFFRSQVQRFSQRRECTLYLARYQGEVAAASIHMHAFGETSYHHGASTHRLSKVPVSYLLQWTAICDALKRGDHVYNFWGIAPPEGEGDNNQGSGSKHPFAGVTLFKTGFGGHLLPLVHCMDFPLSARYHGTRAFELFRKWRRGF
ncbi:MAG: peptidoglycan bridge formation glycyltransferase FemA/FemB family protein [Candidatus Peregrinibacteria bacterium]